MGVPLLDRDVANFHQIKVIKMKKLISILLISLISTSQVQCTTPSPWNPDVDGIPIETATPLPYALSATYLTYLARKEQEVYKEVKQYTNDLQDRLRLAQAYLKDYEDSTLKGTSHLPENTDPWQKAAESTYHPLIAYRMVRRFSQDFQKLATHMHQSLESNMEQRLKAQGLYNWPGDKDHVDAMDAILRLHYVYKMDIEQLTNGNIEGVVTNVGLTAQQVFNIAEYAVNNEYYTLAFDWLNAAESKIKIENCTSVGPFQIANLYRRNIELHDMYYDEKQNVQHLYIFDRKLGDSKDLIRMQDIKTQYYNENLDDPAIEGGHYKFLSLCNGANFQNKTVKSKLKCWLDTKRHPYFTINPLKIELLNEEPLLIQIYDMISDNWINELKKTAIPSLRSAPTVIVNNEPGSAPRTATYAWLLDEDIPNVPISRRIELITDLNVRGMPASEALQIAAYTYGGHVSTHYDSLSVSNPNDPIISLKGDRVLTFLIYLNDVEKGGLTAFPSVGTYVRPVKGSAVYWYTALRNGAIDLETLHGACPVIMGHKWIATKWVHSFENTWKLPCALDSSL